MLTLAQPRVGNSYTQLAAEFGVGTTTGFRYVAEAVEFLATLTPNLADAVRTTSAKAYLILDGTLLPDRLHRRRPPVLLRQTQGTRMQVLADPSADCCGPRPDRRGRPTRHLRQVR